MAWAWAQYQLDQAILFGERPKLALDLLHVRVDWPAQRSGASICGYLVNATMTHRYTFDYNSGDGFSWAAGGLIPKVDRTVSFLVNLEVDPEAIVGLRSFGGYGEGYDTSFRPQASPGVWNVCHGNEFKRLGYDNPMTGTAGNERNFAETARLIQN